MAVTMVRPGQKGIFPVAGAESASAKRTPQSRTKMSLGIIVSPVHSPPKIVRPRFSRMDQQCQGVPSPVGARRAKGALSDCPPAMLAADRREKGAEFDRALMGQSWAGSVRENDRVAPRS